MFLQKMQVESDLRSILFSTHHPTARVHELLHLLCGHDDECPGTRGRETDERKQTLLLNMTSSADARSPSRYQDRPLYLNFALST